jgi:dihydroorotate dehydrogenase
MVMTLTPLIISAPFGNYIQPTGVTATLGTFTALRRPGRLLQIIKTVRYYRRIGAWVNRIGLRNPGIDWLTQRAAAGRLDVSDKIVSIHGFNDDEWFILLDKLALLQPMAVELNMSCPNVGHINWPAELFHRAMETGLTVIVKLPPVHYELMTEQAIAAGVMWFHCCNTLPVPAGGVSGQPLKPVALQCIRVLRQQYTDRIRLIGGGGIRKPEDIDDYADAGADHFAIATKVFHPKFLLSTASLKPLIEQANLRCG